MMDYYPLYLNFNKILIVFLIISNEIYIKNVQINNKIKTKNKRNKFKIYIFIYFHKIYN